MRGRDCGSVNLPSFDQAAERGVSRANRPRESAENLIIALSHGVEPKVRWLYGPVQVGG